MNDMTNEELIEFLLSTLKSINEDAYLIWDNLYEDGPILSAACDIYKRSLEALNVAGGFGNTFPSEEEYGDGYDSIPCKSVKIDGITVTFMNGIWQDSNDKDEIFYTKDREDSYVENIKSIGNIDNSIIINTKEHNMNVKVL